MKKKIIATSLAFFSLIVLLITMPGCKKDQTTPEPVTPPAKLQILYVHISPDTIIPGGTVSVDVKIRNAKKIELKVNGVSRMLLDSVDTKPLLLQTTSLVSVEITGNDNSFEKRESNVVVSNTTNNPTIHLTATPNPRDGSGDVIITITASHFDYITTNVPGGNIPGTFHVSLNQTTTFYGEAHKGNLKSADSLTVVVNQSPAPTPLLDAVVKNPFSETDSKWKCSEGDSWQPATIPPEDLAVKWVFSRDGKWKAYRYGSEIAHCDFIIDEIDSTMLLGEIHYKIHRIDTIMILERQNDVPYSLCPDGLAYGLEEYSPATLP